MYILIIIIFYTSILSHNSSFTTYEVKQCKGIFDPIIQSNFRNVGIEKPLFRWITTEKGLLKNNPRQSQNSNVSSEHKTSDKPNKRKHQISILFSDHKFSQEMPKLSDLK